MTNIIKNSSYNEFWNDDDMNVKSNNVENSNESNSEIKKLEKKVSTLEKKIKTIKNDDIKPVNPSRGWHVKNEYIDEIGNIFEKGVYIGNVKDKQSNIVGQNVEANTSVNIKISKNKEIIEKTQPKKTVNINNEIKSEIKKKKEIKNVIVKSNKEIYQEYITEKYKFRIFYRGELLFDSNKHDRNNYPIFNEDGFILFGKNYIYRGTRIEKY